MIALARHGETPYNVARRFQGHLPVPLTERGIAQARELAAKAAERRWSALICSPLRRARQTAEIVAEAVGLEPIEDPRFAETDCGDWTDRLFDDVAREHPELFRAYITGQPDFAFPGGESFAEQQARVLEGIADIRERVRAAGGEPVLVVCHRGTIRLALAALHGDDELCRAPIPNASLVELP